MSRFKEIEGYNNDYFIEMGYEANKNNSVKIGRYYDDLHNHVTRLNELAIELFGKELITTYYRI